MMTQSYRHIFINEVGQPHRESDLPVPWFARNVWNKVQWAAYIGDCFGPGALAFGISIEFLPTWRKIRPRLVESVLEECLKPLANDEWHWEGRPGFLCRNPGVEPLYSHQRVAEIDLSQWLRDLDEILHGQRRWQDGRPMRPQLQIMRRVGNCGLSCNMTKVRGRIRDTIRDMHPLMNLLCNRCYMQ